VAKKIKKKQRLKKNPLADTSFRANQTIIIIISYFEICRLLYLYEKAAKLFTDMKNLCLRTMKGDSICTEYWIWVLVNQCLYYIWEMVKNY